MDVGKCAFARKVQREKTQRQHSTRRKTKTFCRRARLRQRHVLSKLSSHPPSLCVPPPLSQVLAEAELAPLRESSRNLTYDLLCALADPSREDTRGLSHLAEAAERFAFSLLAGSNCEM